MKKAKMKTNKKKMNELDELPRSLIDAIDKNLAELPKSDLDEKLAASYDAYDLAMLAAEVCRGVQDPDKAIEKAWGLLRAGELHLRGIALDAKENSPRAEAEWREQEEKRLASLRIKYDNLKRVVTGHLKHYDRADKWFNQSLDAKAKRDGKNEVWVDALKLTYRNKTFTGTEAKKLQEEYRQWRGYRGQGRVIREGDLRLKENKKKKLEKAQKEQTRQGRPRQSSKNPFWDSTEARRAAAEKRSANPKGGS
jgi:hypothetical protein